MNVWFVAAACLLAGLFPCIGVALRGRIADALIAMQIATALTVVAMLLIEQGLQRQTFFDVSLALAVLSLPSTLLFARVYRRWL